MPSFLRLPRLLVVAGLLTIGGLPASPQVRGPVQAPVVGKEQQMEITYQTSPADTRDVTVALSAAHRAAIEAGPPAKAPVMPTGYRLPNGNVQQNARAGVLGNPHYAVRWKAPVLADQPARYVLTAGSSVLIQGRVWQLFDASGNALGNGRTGPGQMFLDPADQLFYFLDSDGFLNANGLSDGKRRFLARTAAGDSGGFTFVERNDAVFLLVSSESPGASFEQLDPASRGQPMPTTASTIETLRPGNNARIESSGLMAGMQSLTATIASERIVAARNGGTIVFAVPGALVYVDTKLEVTAAYRLAATPLALSLDEADTAYLIVQAAEGRQLWKISRKGAIGFTVELPGGSDPFPKPPAVGYDHRVFVIAGGSLLAIEPDGTPGWRNPISSDAAGMLVTADGYILASDGAELVSFDDKGKRVRMVTLDGEKLSTPPAMSDEGEILVATNRSLYCLARQP
jgi:hypothetical protein